MPTLPVPPWIHSVAVTARIQLDLARATLDAVQPQLVAAARTADWQSTTAHAFHDRISALRAALDTHADRIHEVSIALEGAMSAAAADRAGVLP